MTRSGIKEIRNFKPLSSVAVQKELEGLHLLCSESKGTDQLHGYCAADLRLFSHMLKVGFRIMWLF